MTNLNDDSQIYVACLSSYNHGILHGKWITPESDKQLLQDQINDIIKNSPVEDAEEWAIHDYDNFPNLGEYPGIDAIIKVQKAIEEHGIYLVNAFFEVGTFDNLDEMQDRFYGEYKTFQIFAYEFAHETIPELNENTTLARYFDYDAFERDLSYDFDEAMGENGTSLIFSNH